VRTIGAAARECEVAVVTGDTKVVERGKGDGIFVTTTGVGVVSPGAVTPSADRARPGDHVLVSGTLGDHGLAILSTLEGLSFEAPLVSDTAPLHGLVAAMAAASPSLSVLRDPTRGGLAATLNEICAASRVGVTLDEAALPIRAPVRAAAELLGIDPLDVANEGKLVAVVPAAEAPKVLAAMRAHPLGRDAADVGVVVEDDDHLVELCTTFGGTRIVRWPLGEPLPRIC
jgi:hydrogenase expression/formation protein HypE